GRGEDPRWVEITWDEALDTVAQKLTKVREDDPRKLVVLAWDIGPYGMPVTQSFMSAFGTPNYMRGASSFFCGQALHPIAFLTHGTFFMEPDFRFCNYLILMGSQLGFMVGTSANLLTQRMADARMRGMKVVVVDPILTPAAAKADEWVPIRPGTDGALSLGLLNVLLNDLGIYDREFLQKHTNGPYLIGQDGEYLRDQESGKPLVWDTVEGVAKRFDVGEPAHCAIEGSYAVSGNQCRPSFQALKDHVHKYTPEYVAEITTVPAETIRRLAKEYGEAARVGSTIVVEGKSLPYRPAGVTFNRGSTAHKDAILVGMAMHLLNIVVGAIDVPGGTLGCSPLMHEGSVARFHWGLDESEDGLLVPGPRRAYFYPYPARKASAPETVHLAELCPVSIFMEGLTFTGVKIPYEPEVAIHSRQNLMMSTGDPEVVAAWLAKIPFMVSFALQIDETAEFADIVIPDTHYLERLEPFPNIEQEFIEAGLGEWCYELRQPIVVPPPGVRHWLESVLEVSGRIGMLSEVYEFLNMILKLEEPHRLDPTKVYTWEELVSITLESSFGSERNLEWFKQNGVIKWPKKIEEAYPRAFLKPRVQVYLEYMKQAGEDVRAAAERADIAWDTSGYLPMLEWRPCVAETSKEHDLFAVSYKLQFHSHSYTTENPWLNELGEHHPSAYKILMNGETARRKGIRDGDSIWLETPAGRKVGGRVKLTEGIHPEVLGIAGTFGHWAAGKPIAKGKGVHFNSLLPLGLEQIDYTSAAVDCCLKVRVYK
ncbi:MAG: molybdopterin-dependent oxidoreductase, partial [Chloroflexi bacterium]|nr:molybdopterin-dependent oxidoreductase [Chloroflexota bacterium]